MNIIPWRRRDTFSPTTMDLEDFWSRLWNNGDGDLTSHLPEVFGKTPVPPVNIAETEEDLRVTMDCPGLDEGDFQVETMGNQLVISGERKWEEEKKAKEFRRVESQYGKFQRTVQLPDNVRTEADKIKASYKRGVLTVVIPKREKTPSARIPVKAG